MDFTIGGSSSNYMDYGAGRGGYGQGSGDLNDDIFNLSFQSAQTSTDKPDKSDKSGRPESPGRADSAGQGDGRAGRQATGAENEDRLELSPEAQRMVEELKARDREVRAHEAAHVAAGGGVVKGGAQFSMQRGPDGQVYAVGGEVAIDTSRTDDPRANMAKARQIIAAALAPADPSPQDRAVAATASQMEAQAASELAREAVEKNRQGEGDRPDGPNGAGNPDGRAEGDRGPFDAQRSRRAADAYGALGAFGDAGVQGVAAFQTVA